MMIAHLKDSPKESYLKRVQWYLKQLDALMRVIGTPPLSSADKSNAQMMLKEIKEHFAEDNRISRSGKRLQKMSTAEQQYYGIIANASATLMVRSNTDPVKSKWSGDLYRCHAEIMFYYREDIETETD